MNSPIKLIDFFKWPGIVPAIYLRTSRLFGVMILLALNIAELKAQCGNVNPKLYVQPQISGPALSCSGSTYTVTNNSQNFVVVWTVSGGDVISGGSPGKTVTVGWHHSAQKTIRAYFAAGPCSGPTATRIIDALPNINGPTFSCHNSNATYSVTNNDFNEYVSWTISGGDVISGGSPGETVTIRWHRSAGGTVSARFVRAICTGPTATKNVTISSPLQPGSIAGNQVLCNETDPAVLSSISPASGGNGAINYQWQYSNNGSTSWTDIGSANSSSYDPPVGLPSDRWYRRIASNNCMSSISNNVKVSVNNFNPKLYDVPHISGPALSCSGNSYTVTNSENLNVVWTITGGSIISGGSPGNNITVSWYQNTQKTIGAHFVAGPCSGPMATRIIDVLPQISGPSFSCYNSSTTYTISNNDSDQYVSWTILGGDVISGGSPGETITIRWNQSAEGTVAARFVVGPCSSPTTSKTIVLRPLLQPGSIEGDQGICEWQDPTILSSISPASGGHGTITYQWQYSTSGVSQWTNLSNGTSASYDPPGGIPSDRWYRRMANDECMSVTSNSVKISVRIPQFISLSDKNYVSTTTIRIPGVKVMAGIDQIPSVNGECDPNTLKVGEASMEIQYFDGLGRPSQQIALMSSPGFEDMVRPLEYDALAIETKKYLPYIASSNDGSFKNNAISAQMAYYNSLYSGDRPYSEARLEDSPLNRIIEQGAPGADWQIGRATIRQSYETNLANEVILWKAAEITSQTKQYYGPRQLYKNTVTDEDGNPLISFVDRQGRTVLKKSQVDASTWAETYYIYDDLGRLRIVLPPAASDRLNNEFFAVSSNRAAFLHRWAFLYEYDERNRMIEKRAPGAQPVYLVYDTRDRLVLSQDGNQRDDKNDWTFTKYDALNRQVLTGVVDMGVLSLTAIRTAVKNANQFYEEKGTDVHGYTNNTYPPVANENDYLTVTYYDDYTFPHATYYPFVVELGNNLAHDPVRGQVTGTKSKSLDGSNVWMEGVLYYDDRYRVIQSQSENLIGEMERITYRYDFVGNVLETKTSHEKKVQPIVWADLVGVKVNSNSLTKTASSVWGNAGAASTKSIATGEDGWIEMEAIETNKGRMFGLSTTNASANYNTIGYAIYPFANGTVHVYENGTPVGPIGTYQQGSKLRVERVGTSILYKIDGAVKHTSSAPSTGPLLADVALFQTGSTISNAVMSSAGNTKEYVIHRQFDYDHEGRLVNTWHEIIENGTSYGQKLLSHNEYNELGELIEKNLHSEDNGSSFAQSIDYRYNIRGWLTGINDSDLAESEAQAENDYFGMELGYNTTLPGISAVKTFNGNISAVKWSDDLGLSQRGYAYSYDGVNRITSAGHFKNDVSTPNYGISGLSYDLNGNIKTLARNGSSGDAMDVLTYYYGTGAVQSNQLLSVSDDGDDNQGFKDGNTFGNDYAYDENGNMTQDLNKGITSVVYNYLNLPQHVEKDASNYIKYIYDAGGIKHSQIVYEIDKPTKRTDYIGEFIYENDELQLIQHEEGRIVPNNDIGSFDYEYFLKDHLGNNRVVFTTNPKTISFTATMESEEAANEEALFSNLPGTREKFAAASHSPDKVAKLDAQNSVGPAISLQVGAGDTVEIEGYAYFEGGTGYSNPGNLPAFVAAVAGAFGGINGSGVPAEQATFDMFDNAYGIIGLQGTDADTIPAAYLNYILFDQNMTYIRSGFKQVSSSANFDKEYVTFPGEIVIEEPGFIYCFVSMESATGRVFWDDVKVTLHEHPVVQTNDYYPGGLTFDSFNRITTTKNRFLYNDGTERIDDLDLGVDMTLYRVYDPGLMKFWQIDPKADQEGQESWTPYHYSFNNPIRFNDPLGDNPILRLLQMAQRARPALQRGTQWVQRNGARAGRAIQAGWNSAHRSVYYANTSQWMRTSQNWVAQNIQGATSYYYRNAQLVGEAGAFLASAVDPNPAANYSVGAGDELGNAVGATIRKGSGVVLDFFGGAKSAIKNGVSIDPKSVSGFRGTISEFAEQFAGSKVSEIVANNPQATFMKEAASLLESGGTLTMRGTMSNKFFNKIAKGKDLDGFEVIQQATKISNEGYKKTDGSAIQGQMFELILKRVE